MDFIKRSLGALGRCDRIACRLGRLIFIGEQQRSPHLDQMPVHVVREHAQEYVCADAVFEPVIDRTDLQVQGFQGTERAFDLSERFVAAYRVGRRHLFLG
jgi:hypothetical protein